MRSIRFALIAMLLGGVAYADDKKPADPPAAAPAPKGDVKAEIKAGTGVEKHEVVGEGTSFSKGTTVWAWSRISNGNGTNVKHVWKHDGKEVWTAVLPIGSELWSTMSRRTIETAGAWEVEVTTEAGASLGKVAFTIN